MSEQDGALTQNERAYCARMGMLPYEIEELNNARDVSGALQNLNFKADNFQTMLNNRAKFVYRLQKMGWSKLKIAALIGSYYEGKRSKRSVFDLLQVEQSPSARTRQQSDTEIARRLLKQARIRATFGKNYTEGLEVKVMPRNIPPAPTI